MMTKNKVILWWVAVVALWAVFIWGGGLGGELSSAVLRMRVVVPQTTVPMTTIPESTTAMMTTWMPTTSELMTTEEPTTTSESKCPSAQIWRDPQNPNGVECGGTSGLVWLEIDKTIKADVIVPQPIAFDSKGTICLPTGKKDFASDDYWKNKDRFQKGIDFARESCGKLAIQHITKPGKGTDIANLGKCKWCATGMNGCTNPRWEGVVTIADTTMINALGSLEYDRWIGRFKLINQDPSYPVQLQEVSQTDDFVCFKAVCDFTQWLRYYTSVEWECGTCRTNS